MDDTPGPDAGTLRFLKLLVTGLTATMIAGLLVLIVLFVTRFPSPQTPLPEAIALPGGTRATAFTQGATWYAIVTDGDEILIYDRETGQIAQRIAILPAD